MNETRFQAKIAEMCAEFGLYHHHDPDSRRSTSSGWPDSVILNLVTGAIIFRELKMPGRDLSSEQRRVGYALQAGGHDWAVWRLADLAAGTITAELSRLATRP